MQRDDDLLDVGHPLVLAIPEVKLPVMRGLARLGFVLGVAEERVLEADRVAQLQVQVRRLGLEKALMNGLSKWVDHGSGDPYCRKGFALYICGVDQGNSLHPQRQSFQRHM